MQIDIRQEINHSPSLRESDNGYEWNNNQERVIQQWGTTAQYYNVMHNRAAKYNETLNRWLGIPAVVLSGIIGTAEFAALGNSTNCGRTNWVHILAGILAFMSFGLGVAYNFLGFEERVRKHLLASSLYESLYYDITEELSYYGNQRKNVRSFMRTAKKNLRVLKEASPDIPNHILNRYIKDLDRLIILSSIAVAEEKNKTEEKEEGEENQQHQPQHHPQHQPQHHPHLPCDNHSPKQFTKDPPSSTPPLPLPQPSSSITSAASAASPTSTDWNLQDEFAEEMNRRISERTNQIEEFYLKKLQTQ